MAQKMQIFTVEGPDNQIYEIEAPAGTSEELILQYASRFFANAPVAEEERSFVDTAKHYAGLGGRTITQAAPSAILGIPALVTDAYGSLVNLQNTALNKFGELTGLYDPDFPIRDPFKTTKAVAQSGKDLADVIGFPTPETETEAKAVQYGTDIGSALGAAGASKMLAKQIAKGGTGAAVPIADIKTAEGARQAIKNVPGLLAEYPIQQAVGAGSATYAANVLADNPELVETLGPEGAALAVMGAGIIGPSGTNLVANVGSKAKSAVKPFSEAGQRAISGKILSSMTTDQGRALNNLADTTEILRGSRMTTGEVAGDPGLAGAQEPIFKGLDTRNLAGQRASERNAIRMREIERLSGGEKGPDYARAKRDRLTAPIREEAFAASDIDPQMLNRSTTLVVNSTIDRILSGPKGSRSDVQEALNWAKNRTAQQIDSAERLYSIRKDLRDASLGKYNQDKPSLKLAKGELEEVIRAIDDVIDAAAPGYKTYLNKYANMSQPIDQMEIMQHLRKASESAAVDVTRSGGAASQFPVLMAGKLKTALNSKMMEKEGVKLSAPQQKMVDKIFSDLRSEMSVTGGSRMTRRPGSDTFKNMTTANVIGNIIGDYLGSSSVGKTISAPMNWIYAIPENKVADILVEAMLDPKLARQLMMEGNTVNVQKISEAIKNKALAQGIITNADLIPK